MPGVNLPVSNFRVHRSITFEHGDPATPDCELSAASTGWNSRLRAGMAGRRKPSVNDALGVLAQITWLEPPTKGTWQATILNCL